MKHLKKSCLSIWLILFIEYICKCVIEKLDYKFINVLREYINIDYTVYTDFLICAIGVAGVFLALYYSNISTIYSSEYSNTPNKVRRLFEYEINNNKSISKINKYIIFTSLVLVCNMVGIKTWYIFIIVSIVKTIDIVISFINRGNIIYEYANIYNVLRNKKKELMFYIDSVVNINRLYNDTMQNTYGKNASDVLEDMDLVNNYILEKKDINEKESIKEFLNENIYFLICYLQEKNKIMFNSLWFQKIPKYKKWYNADFGEKSIAIYTGTELQPREISDLDWFEKNILKMNEKGIFFLINNNCYKEVQEYLYSIIDSIPFWIRYGNISLFYEHIVKIVDAITKEIQKESFESQKEIEDTIEYVKVILIDFVLKIREYILNIKLDKYEIFQNGKYKFNDNSLINMNDIVVNNSEFYDIYKGLKNEIKLENRIITPKWYIKQRVSKIYAQRINIFLEYIEKIYSLNNKIEENLFEYSQYECSSSLLVNENELYNKIKTLYEDTKSILEEMEDSNIVEEDRVPKIKFKEIISKICSIHKEQIPTLWSKHCEIWGIRQENNGRDVFGFCYNNLCEFIFDSIIRFDYDTFEKNYNNILRIAILSEISIHEEVKDNKEYNDFAKVKFQFSGLNNMFKISGYAIIIGEVLNDTRWKAKIDSELQKLINKSEKINFIEQIKRWKIAIQWLADDIRNIEIDGTNMDLRFRNAIENSNKLKFKSVGPFGQKKIINTKNLEKIYYSETSGISADMREIFAIACLNKYLEQDDKYSSERMILKEWEEENEEKS